MRHGAEHDAGPLGDILERAQLRADIGRPVRVKVLGVSEIGRDRVNADDAGRRVFAQVGLKLRDVLAEQEHGIGLGVALDRLHEVDALKVGAGSDEARHHRGRKLVLRGHHDGIARRAALGAVRPIAAGRGAGDVVNLNLRFTEAGQAGKQLKRAALQMTEPHPRDRARHHARRLDHHQA